MNVLVLNVGSSSLKAALYGDGQASLWQLEQPRQGPLSDQLAQGLAPQLKRLGSQGALVGHRLVHGGERFTAATRIEAAVLDELEALSPLAPLHNPPAVAAIRWLAQERPELEQWACFDTAFHASLPAAAYSYALPEAWRQGGCRRYGFHGLNHQHVAETALRRWRAEGRSVDTSMGFTPLEGLVMATRSGSVDPGLLLHLQRRGLSLDALEQGLNQASGLLGLSGLSGDWRELRQAAAGGHDGAQLALAVFGHRLRSGIGAMAASLEGVDQIALSGGIGARDAELLQELQGAMAWLGPVQWLQIPADEEGMIARQVLRASGPLSGPADPGSGAADG